MLKRHRLLKPSLESLKVKYPKKGKIRKTRSDGQVVRRQVGVNDPYYSSSTTSIVVDPIKLSHHQDALTDIQLANAGPQSRTCGVRPDLCSLTRARYSAVYCSAAGWYLYGLRSFSREYDSTSVDQASASVASRPQNNG